MKTKTMKGTNIRLLLAAAITLGLSSCFKEDMTDCIDPRGNVHVSMRLTVGVVSRASSLADFDITDARVWAFDAENNMAAFALAELNSDGICEAWMSLPSGNYNFVAWTGNDSVYKVTEASSAMNDMVLSLDRPGDKPITETIPDLLYGSEKVHVMEAVVASEVVMNMSPDTYNINVTAKGLEQGSDIWEASIYKNNTCFRFNHDLFHEARVLHHMRTGALTSDGRFDASMRIVAPGADTPGADGDPRLVLRNTTTGEVIYDMSLVKTILDAYAANGQEIDLEHPYTYDIVLTFDASLGVSVSVNGWEHEKEPTDLG
jgi:hypothetical protein